MLESLQKNFFVQSMLICDMPDRRYVMFVWTISGISDIGNKLIPRMLYYLRWLCHQSYQSLCRLNICAVARDFPKTTLRLNRFLLIFAVDQKPPTVMFIPMSYNCRLGQSSVSYLISNLSASITPRAQFLYILESHDVILYTFKQVRGKKKKWSM